MAVLYMPLRNQIKGFVDGKEITPYQFCKDTGLSQNTGYGLYNNPEIIPGPTALAKICTTYKVQSGELIIYVPE